MQGRSYVNRNVVQAIAAAIVLTTIALLSCGAQAAQDLASYLPKIAPADFFRRPTGSARRRAIRPSSRSIAATSCWASSISIPISPTRPAIRASRSSLLVGIDPNGVITGVKLVEHKEPIVLIGIPARIVDARQHADRHGHEAGRAVARRQPPQVDIVSGATVTVLVMGDSVVRSAVEADPERTPRWRPAGRGRRRRRPVTKTVDLDRSEIRDWETLLGDGSVRRLHLTIGEVNEAFANPATRRRARIPSRAIPATPSSTSTSRSSRVPTIGRSLLGDDGYERLKDALKPGQQAIVVAGDGAYSFKGSGYVRGGIFDRIELLQDGTSTRFRDRNHTRLGASRRPARRSAGDRALHDPARVHASTRPSPGSCNCWCSARRRARQGVPDLRARLHPARRLPAATACRARRAAQPAAQAGAARRLPSTRRQQPPTDATRAALAADLAGQDRHDRHHRRRAGHPDRHLLLPGRAGAAAAPLRLGPPRLPRSSRWSGSAGTPTRSSRSSTC